MTPEAYKARAVAFMRNFAGSAAIDLHDFTPDATWWTLATGNLPIAVQGERTARLADARFAGPGSFEIGDVTAEDNRVAIEAKGHQPLTDGSSYDNTYLWLIRFEGEKISSVKAWFDTALAARTFQPATA